MSTNSLTYSAATGIASDRQARANGLYGRLVKRATRAVLNGDDQAADAYAERARKHAHAESFRGNLDPLLDQLARHYGLAAPII